MDLRIEKTEKAIRNAFIELRSKQPLSKITVKELCALACINKSTFYSHYNDIYDLSYTLETETIQSIINSIPHPEYIFDRAVEFTQELGYAFISQSSLTNILFSGDEKHHFSDYLEKGLKDMIYEKYPSIKDNMAINMILSYCIQGSYQLVMDYKAQDVETLMKVMHDITERIQPLFELYA